MGLDLTEIGRIETEIADCRLAPLAPALQPFGERPTAWHGQGMETVDTRPYVEGDDLRHLDWRATARSGRALSRVFADERRHGLCLVLDHRATMRFASRGEPKSRRASRCAALLALMALRRREPVAILRLSDEGHGEFLPPSRDLAAITAPLQARRGRAHELTGVGLADCVEWLDPRLEPGCIVLFISDMIDYHDVEHNLGRDLAPLTRKQSVAVIVVRDPLEIDLPIAGRLRLVGADGRTVIVDSRDEGIRHRYRNEQAGRLEALLASCRGRGIGGRLIRTDEPVAPETLFVLA